MKLLMQFAFLCPILFLSSCSNGQSEERVLSAKAFSEKINETPNSTIIDVRTPEEFSQGHIENAHNINWNDDLFETEIKKIDVEKPVFVYCLSGGRSSAAISKIKSLGFKEVYELKGGMLKWRAENLPETVTNTPTSNGMSLEDYKKMLDSDKLVLVDFYAEWCEPCKKMEPFLKEIAEEKSTTVKLIRINIDENMELAKALKIEALPIVKLYKNQTIIWDNQGFVTKEEILKHLQ
jgi:thioredoxin